MSLLLPLLALIAHAGGLQPPTSRHPLPSRIVERSVVLPKGWTELQVSGELAAGDGGNRQTVAAMLTHGVGPGHALWLRLPWHALSGPAEHGLGDLALGWRVSLGQKEPPNQSIALDIGLVAPSSAGRMGDGSHGFLVGLIGRRQLGPWLLTVSGSGVARLPNAGVVESVRVWRDPADRVVATVDLALQAGPLWVGLEGGGAAWSAAKLDREITQERGMGADIQVHGTAQLTRGFDISLARAFPLKGEGVPRALADSMRLGAGPRWTLTVAGRW